jgi:hypothetical protein
MAKENSTSAGANGNGNAENGGGRQKRWLKIKTDRPFWSPERGKGKPVTGVLLALIELGGKSDDGTPRMAFVMRLTEPATCKVNDKDKLIAEGEEVLIPANNQLQRYLLPYATKDRIAFEMQIVPAGQTKTRRGTFVNLYEFHISDQPVMRTQQDRLLGMTSVSHPMLTSGGADADGGVVE